MDKLITFRNLGILISIFAITFLTACGGGSSPTTSPPPPQPPSNNAPTASVPDDFSVEELTAVSLDGSASSDADGSITSFLWEQTGGSPSVTLTNPSSNTASFTAPDINSNTVLSFQLTVTDNDGATASNQVAVTVTPVQAGNQPPTAIAPNDFNVTKNTQVVLDASASSDSDGNIVSYLWTQTAGTPTVTLANNNTDTASFTAPDVATDTPLTFELTVTDNDGDSSTDSVVVTVQDSVAVVITSIDTKLTTVPFPGTRTALASFEFAGPQNATFECSLDSATFEACTSPHQVTVADGFHDFEVRYVDNGQTDPTPAKWRWEYLNEIFINGTSNVGLDSAFTAAGSVVSANSDLGSFTTSCEAITSLTVQNDQTFSREELTWTSIAIPRELNLTDADNLILIGEAEHQVAVQFRPIARWDAAPDDTTAPLKWLEVAAVSTVGPQTTSIYSLRHCASPPATADKNQLSLTENNDGTFTLDTNIAQFTLDPQDDRLLRLANIGNKTIVASIHELSARTGRSFAEIIPNSFTIEQSGPVKLVASVKGHFNDLPADPLCTNPPSYTLRMTFVRRSADIDVEYLLTNECGDGMFPNGPGAAQDGSDWWNRTLPIQSLNLTWSVDLDPATTSVHRNTSDTNNIVSSAPNQFSSASIVQRNGSSSNSAGSDWRIAESTLTGSNTLVAEAFDLPSLAITDQEFTAMVQIPWMKYREPLSSNVQTNPGLSFITVDLFDSSATTNQFIGEAQGIWNFFRLSFANTQLDSTAMFTKAQQNQASMERGLLWHSPVWNLNQAKVFPEIANYVAPEFESWRLLIEGAHDNTVTDSILGGAQRDRMKGYSLIGWPDNMAEGIKDIVNTSLNEYTPGSNVWSPTNSELLMWYATGEPKWAWDYALPAEWTFWHTNTYNTGSRGVVGSRSGLVIASASNGEGARYRSGYGTDDKMYNQGSEKAYVLRPHQSLVDRFQAAGDTYISRYVDDVNNREEFVSSRSLSRQTVQHLNALQLAAKYSTTNSIALRAKFNSVMQEYIDDNLSNGIFCGDDDPTVNINACVFAFDGVFHYVALWQEVFLNYAMDLDPSDPNRAVVMNAIAQTARLIDNGIPRDGSGNIIDFSPTAWGNSFQCDFSTGSDVLQQCQQFNCNILENPQGGNCTADPTYDNAHLNTLATVMLGHKLNPTAVSQARCDQIKAAFNSNLNGGTVAGHMSENGFGWHKDSSQLAQMIIYGIAAAQQCN